jgi:hypothetical protein
MLARYFWLQMKAQTRMNRKENKWAYNPEIKELFDIRHDSI